MGLDDYLMQYLQTFDEGFPMYQLGRGRTDEEIIAIIKRCLEIGMDVYDAGYLQNDEDEY